MYDDNEDQVRCNSCDYSLEENGKDCKDNAKLEDTNYISVSCKADTRPPYFHYCAFVYDQCEFNEDCDTNLCVEGKCYECEQDAVNPMKFCKMGNMSEENEGYTTFSC